MKKTLLLFFLILTVYTGFSQCPPAGDVKFETQAQVDAFAVSYPTCTKISGSLIIGKLDGSNNIVQTDITTLDPINNITEITGDLNIYGNPSLTTLSGLSNVETFNGFISLYWNGLTEITGLSKISGSIGTLYIGYNSALSNLTGLDGITTINGYTWINGNDILTNLTGLGKLESITDFFYVDLNPKLNNFEGIGSSIEVSEITIGNYLWISDNNSLDNFTGFEKLKSVGDLVRIDLNANLKHLKGLEGLTDIGTNLFIVNNINLVSLSDSNTAPFENGLINLTNIGGSGQGGIQLDDNVSLIDISGIGGILDTDINQLTIRRNTELEECHIDNVCAYLAPFTAPYNGGVAIITGNKGTCEDGEALEAVCKGTASTSDYLLENAISVYPNPVNDMIYIKKISNIEIQNIELYNMQGTLVKESRMIDDQLDVSNISAGMYFLKITTNDGVATKKMVKQ